jgi:hypothetical protein
MNPVRYHAFIAAKLFAARQTNAPVPAQGGQK